MYSAIFMDNSSKFWSILSNERFINCIYCILENKIIEKIVFNAKEVFETSFPLGCPLGYFSRTKPHLEPKNENHVTRAQAQRV